MDGTMLSKTVSCLTCGWIHFEVTGEEALAQIKQYNDYCERVAPERGDLKRASIDTYEHCLRCNGSYQNFDVIDETDIPLGITIGPILARTET